MKKIMFILVGFLLCFCLACGKKLTTYTEINYEQYVQKLEDKETFSMVIGSATCKACAIFKGTMEKFIEKYQVEVFYIDISKLENEEYSTLKTQISFDGTPTTIFISNGEVTSFYNRIDGSAGLSTVTNAFKNNGYID